MDSGFGQLGRRAMQVRARAMESRPHAQGKVNESRAAILLGLSRQTLRRLSELSGLGRPDEASDGAELVFTYAELYRLCRLAAKAHS
jgi:hypothetical protein